jgi:hypothetical protein
LALLRFDISIDGLVGWFALVSFFNRVFSYKHKISSKPKTSWFEFHTIKTIWDTSQEYNPRDQVSYNLHQLIIGDTSLSILTYKQKSNFKIK